MKMPTLKSLFTNTERRLFPEVVVPLPRDSHHVTSESSGEKTDSPSSQPPGYSSNSEPGSIQEKGVAARTSGGLTFESLRAEIEEGVVAGGHDSIYDRMSWFPTPMQLMWRL